MRKGKNSSFDKETRMKLFQDSVFGEIYPESERIPFRIRAAGHFRIDPSCKQKIRLCNFVELFWCMEGSCRFRYPEGTFTMKPGEVCFYNTGCLHDYTPSVTGFHYCWLSFEGPLAEAFFQGFRTSRIPRYAGECPEELFTLLMAELAMRDARSAYAALATGIRIVTAALTPSVGEIERHPDYVSIVRRLIDENFSNPDTTVNFLSDQLHLHRVYLSRLFRKKTGISISEYLYTKRLEHAMMLLARTDYPIYRIALMCGFSDSAYFMRFFRKRIGTPPSRFRLSNTLTPEKLHRGVPLN